LGRAGDARIEHDERCHVRLVDSGERVHWYYYDSLDQLAEVRTSAGQRYRAEYDVFGRRTRKDLDGRGRCFYWSGNRLDAEVSTSGAVRVYVYSSPSAIVPFMWVDYDRLDAPPESGARYFVLSNHLGCPLMIVDDNGTVMWSATITPYGDATVSESAEIHQPLRYPGWYYDDELEMVYNRFRTYSPPWGRFLESNPIGVGGGMNLYTLLRPPVSAVAPRGLSQHDDVLVSELGGLNEMRPVRELSRLVC
jgi:RHS repeat-associated protein